MESNIWSVEVAKKKEYHMVFLSRDRLTRAWLQA